MVKDKLVSRPLRGVDIGLNLLVALLLVGGGGYAMDAWCETSPLFMLIGGLLGFVAWLWQVWKLMQDTHDNG